MAPSSNVVLAAGVGGGGEEGKGEAEVITDASCVRGGWLAGWLSVPKRGVACGWVFLGCDL